MSNSQDRLHARHVASGVVAAGVVGAFTVAVSKVVRAASATPAAGAAGAGQLSVAAAASERNADGGAKEGGSAAPMRRRTRGNNVAGTKAADSADGAAAAPSDSAPAAAAAAPAAVSTPATTGATNASRGGGRTHHAFTVSAFDQDGNEVAYDARIQLRGPAHSTATADGEPSGDSDAVLPLLTLPTSLRVYIVDDATVTDRLLAPVLAELAADPHKHMFMGLDTEWTQGSRVALLQIDDGARCFLFRVLKIQESIEAARRCGGDVTSTAAGGTAAAAAAVPLVPDSLRQLLEHPRVMFSGAAIGNDVKLLRAQLGVGEATKFIDLQHVCARHPAIRTFVEDGGDGRSLRGLTRRFLGRDLAKDHKIRCGDWGVDEYSHDQVHYAAADAVVGRRVLFEMARHAAEADGQAAVSTAASAAAATTTAATTTTTSSSGGGGSDSGAGSAGSAMQLSPVSVRRRDAATAAVTATADHSAAPNEPSSHQHPHMTPRQMWAWCIDLLTHARDLDKAERARERKSKQARDAKKQKAGGGGGGTRSRVLLHPVLREHDRQARIALASPKHMARLLAPAGLRRVADVLQLAVPGAAARGAAAAHPQQQQQQQHAFVRASAFEADKFPSNCFPAAVHASMAAAVASARQAVGRGQARGNKKSVRKPREGKGKPKGQAATGAGEPRAGGAGASSSETAGPHPSQRWDPNHDWRAGRPQCVARAVDPRPVFDAPATAVAGAGVAVVGAAGANDGAAVPQWLFTVKKNGGSKQGKAPALKLRLPPALAAVLEAAHAAGLSGLSLPRSRLLELLGAAAAGSSTTPAATASRAAAGEGAEPTGDANGGGCGAAKRTRLQNELLEVLHWTRPVRMKGGEATDEGGIDGGDRSEGVEEDEQDEEECEIPLRPDGTAPLDNSTTLVRAVDAAERERLRLAPCHWFELELPAPVAVRTYSLRATASAACRTNAPSCWLLQGHALNAADHRRAFEERLRGRAHPQQQQGRADTDGWVTLHRVEGGVTVDIDGGATATGGGGNDGGGSGAFEGRATGWAYDTAYSPGDVPGEMRMFDVPAAAGAAVAADGSAATDNHNANAFVRFRWVFFARPVAAANGDGDGDGGGSGGAKSTGKGKSGKAGRTAATAATASDANGSSGADDDGSNDDPGFIDRPVFSVQVSALELYCAAQRR